MTNRSTTLYRSAIGTIEWKYSFRSAAFLGHGSSRVFVIRCASANRSFLLLCFVFNFSFFLIFLLSLFICLRIFILHFLLSSCLLFLGLLLPFCSDNVAAGYCALKSVNRNSITFCVTRRGREAPQSQPQGPGCRNQAPASIRLPAASS